MKIKNLLITSGIYGKYAQIKVIGLHRILASYLVFCVIIGINEFREFDALHIAVIMLFLFNALFIFSVGEILRYRKKIKQLEQKLKDVEGEKHGSS